MGAKNSKEGDSFKTLVYLREDDICVVIAFVMFLKACKEPFNIPPDKTVLWSSMENLANKYAECKGDFTLEVTKQGKCLKLLTEFIKKAELPDSQDKTLRHCWGSISEKLASEAKGDVTVLLNGSSEEPFNPNSTFATMEIPNLNDQTVTSLRVWMIMDDNLTKFKLKSIIESQKKLRKALNPNIGISYLYMPESLLMRCLEVNVITKKDVTEYIVTLNDELFNDRYSLFAPLLKITHRLYEILLDFYDRFM